MYFFGFLVIKQISFRFAVKVGVATAAVYYLKEQDVWKSSNDSIKTLEKVKDSCKPLVQDIKTQIPFEVSSSLDIYSWIKWNCYFRSIDI